MNKNINNIFKAGVVTIIAISLIAPGTLVCADDNDRRNNLDIKRDPTSVEVTLYPPYEAVKDVEFTIRVDIQGDPAFIYLISWNFNNIGYNEIEDYSGIMGANWIPYTFESTTIYNNAKCVVDIYDPWTETESSITEYTTIYVSEGPEILPEIYSPQIYPPEPEVFTWYEGEELFFYATASGGIPSYEYFWDFGDDGGDLPGGQWDKTGRIVPWTFLEAEPDPIPIKLRVYDARPHNDPWYGEIIAYIQIIEIEPPNVNVLTQDPETTAGQPVTIEAEVSDNVGVTEATLHYKYEDDLIFSTQSMLDEPTGPGDTQTVDGVIQLTAGRITDVEYYVTASDASDNIGWDPSDDGSECYIISVTPDTTPPSVNVITQDTVGTTGEPVTITATFSDDVGVTQANLKYKKASAGSYSTKSILSGSATITIPSTSVEDWVYYVTVNDAADNGPIDSNVYTISVSDDDKPVITSSSLPNDAYAPSTVTISAIVTDNIAVTEYTILVDGNLESMTLTGGSTYIYLLEVPSDQTEDMYYRCHFEDAADNWIETAMIHLDVHPTNYAPTASFFVHGHENEDPIRPIQGEELIFDAFDSHDNDDDGTIPNGIALYAWNFGDSDEWIEAWFLSEESHTYTSSGVFTVTLKVTDEEGSVDVTTEHVYIPSISYN